MADSPALASLRTAGPPGAGWARRFPALARLGSSGRTIPLVMQLTATECGPACLAMVLGYHGRRIGREALRDLLSAGRDGTTARDLLNAARHLGLRGRGVKVEIGGLKHLPTASILHWQLSHFVVFDRLMPDGVEIIDPELGRRCVPMSEFGQSFTGVALLLEPSEQFQPDFAQDRPRHGFGRVLWESGPWGRIFSMTFFLQVLVLALPLLTSIIVDRVVPRSDDHMLLVLSVGLGGIVVFHTLASLVRAHLLLAMRTLTDSRVTLDFLEHLIGLPYAFFQRRTTGDLLMRLNSNVLIRQTLTSGVLSGVLDGTLVLAYVCLLFALSPAMGWLVLAFGALQLGITLGTARPVRNANASLVARQVRSEGFQVEMLTGIETLKAMGAETKAQERWADLLVDTLNASLEQGRLSALVETGSTTVRMAAPLVLLLFGAYEVMRGALTLGNMLAVNSFVVGVFAPLSNLASMAAQFQLLGIYLERIADVKETPLEQDTSRIRETPRLRGEIELDHVSFRYGPLEPLVVDDVSLAIRPGQLVAIVGKSGSGKSTLASLLLGLQVPSLGRVLYDRKNMSDLSLRGLRQQMGIVTQRAHLFSAPIRYNIALGDPDMPFEQVEEAAKLAQIHDEIAHMPMGYETILGDSGGSVSGGQRQRIALARALSQRPSILLLDEATSALDAITEAKVQQALESLACTRIVIAHRMSTVRRAGHILVMDGGRLVEQGSHDELLRLGGAYASLVGGQLDGSAMRS